MSVLARLRKHRFPPDEPLFCNENQCSRLDRICDRVEYGVVRRMVYQSEPESHWQPMGLAGVTRIKLAILPLDGSLHACQKEPVQSGIR